MLVVPMPPQASHLHPPSNTPSSYSAPSPSSATTPTPGETRPKLATKPKLTLQTTSLPRTFGRSSTGLSLSLATASPTVSNTFKNAYDVPCPASAIPTTSSSSTSSPTKSSTPLRHSRQASSGNPYQLPLGVKSILRNSPLDHSHRRSVSISTNGGGNGASGSRRVFFPTKKQVTYRQPLEEEIRTVHYVVRHSDLIAEEKSVSDNQKKQEVQAQEQPPQDGSDSDSDSNSSLAPSDSSGSDDDQTGSLTKSERRKRKTLSAERQVRAAALLDGLEGDAYGISTPQTPRQGRVKRRREWRWTLGSLEARNEIYGLPQTPEEAKGHAEGTTPTSTTTTTPSESDSETKHENETESMGSCESDWTSSSWSGSSVASLPTIRIPKPTSPRLHDS